MVSHTVSLAEALLVAVSNGDSSTAEQLFGELDEAFLLEGKFPSDLLEILISGLADASCQSSPESAHILKVFEYNADLLDLEQWRHLVESLEQAYGNFEDPASCILAVEIIANLPEHALALKTLSRLCRFKREFLRSTAVYGLRRLGKKVIGPEILSRIIAQIEHMRNDPSQLVQAEVVKSLS